MVLTLIKVRLWKKVELFCSALSREFVYTNEQALHNCKKKTVATDTSNFLHMPQIWKHSSSVSIYLYFYENN